MIAIIPARGGSKGVPGKNTKMLNGKPLISYTIEAAMKSKYVTDVVVTTDDLNIKETALQYGAKVPFLRPAELAKDSSSAVDVYLHAIRFLREQKKEEIKCFMVLLPTAPLRDTSDIDAAYELFHLTQAETLVSVSMAEVPIHWYYNIDDAGHLSSAELTGSVLMNRQAYKDMYIPNGAIYILNTALLEDRRTYYSDRTVPYIMPREKSVDIDDIIDFKIAEILMSERCEGGL